MAKGPRGDYGEAAVRADDLLGHIADATRDMSALTEEYQDALARLKDEYEARVSPLRGELAEAEKAILALMRSSRAALFGDSDMAYLSNGTLLYHREDRLVIPRNHEGVIAACEELGLDEVVKISRSLDRDALSRLPDDQLALVGVRREGRERYSWKVARS